MSWLHLQDLSAGEIWDSGSIACFSSAFEPARLHCLLLFFLPLLTWVCDLPPLGDIIDFSSHSLPWACKYFHLSQGLWASPPCFSFLPPPPFGKALPVKLASATLPNFFIHGLAGPISSDVPLLLSGFLLSQLLGMLVWLPWPGTDSTCLLSSPTLMRTPILPCWGCIPAKAQQAEATDPMLKKESCLFLSWASIWGSHQEGKGQSVVFPLFSFQFNLLVCWERDQAFTCRTNEMKPQAAHSLWKTKIVNIRREFGEYLVQLPHSTGEKVETGSETACMRAWCQARGSTVYLRWLTYGSCPELLTLMRQGHIYYIEWTDIATYWLTSPLS